MKGRFVIPVLAAVAGLGAIVALQLMLAHRSAGSSGVVADVPPPGRYRGSEPPPGLTLPRFELRSYRGNLIRSRDLRGKVVLVTFLDTECQDMCPLIAHEVSAAMRLLEPRQRSRIYALSISVDPKVDTQAHVRAFLRERQALGVLDFAVGAVADFEPVWKAFHVVAAAQTGDADVHSADVRVFTRRGTWVSTLHQGVDLTPRNLARDAAVALRDVS